MTTPPPTAAQDDHLHPHSHLHPHLHPHPHKDHAEPRRKRGLTIVIKLGTSSICDEETHEPLISTLSLIVETCVKLRREGHQVILVSSGAIGVGLKRLDIPRRPKHLASVQAIAAVGQCRLIALWDTLFKHLGQPIAQILLTRNDIADRTHYLNAANTLAELLHMGIVPIVNENDTIAVTEINFGDNDTLSAITAGMVHADCLFLMTDVDCLYDCNPRTHPDAKPIEVVDDISSLKADVSSAGSSLGTGGMSTKLTAARLATSAGVTTIITRSSTPGRVLDIVTYLQALRRDSGCTTPSTGQASATASGRHSPAFDAPSRLSPHPGMLALAVLHSSAASSRTHIADLPPAPLHTRFTAKPRAIRGRYFWILHGLKPHGVVVIDEGAYKALTRINKAGLLPVGVIDVIGTFGQQECVEISVARQSTDPPGYEILHNAVGRALVNYTSIEISHIKGEISSQIYKILGYADSEHIAHRENIAFFERKEDSNGD